MVIEIIGDAIREYPRAHRCEDWKYGLDDLDFEDFASELATYIAQKLEG